MKLFLIRHGETVDNVAQLYAGSRDSELTNHGYQQALRLGQHFKSQGLRFTHIFSSNLRRAQKTATLIRDAQLALPKDEDAPSNAVPDISEIPLLVEQDFGYYEGKKWYERPPEANVTGKEHHRQRHKDTPGFVDMESQESMARRADLFLDEHILPLLSTKAQVSSRTVAIVSHGVILSVLWKRLRAKLPPKSVTIGKGLEQAGQGISIDRLGGWSNTGYLELHFHYAVVPTVASHSEPALISSQSAPSPVSANSSHSAATSIRDSHTSNHGDVNASGSTVDTAQVVFEPGWIMIVRTVNGQGHLRGLKRTGGGVGSAKHDSSQKKIENFFKRQKVS